MDEYKVRQRIIAILNKGDVVMPQEDKCETGEHYILINEYGVPQCASCFMLFTWKGVRRELFANTMNDAQVIERHKELKHIVRQVENGNPPKNIVHVNDYRYLTGKGYEYIERWFYERD